MRELSLTQPTPASPPTRRWALVCAALAGLCWSAVVGLLFWVDVGREVAALAPLRLAYNGLLLAAGLLTFVPLQWLLDLPGLAFEGVAGTTLLGYTLAFVPAPTGSLLALPEVPVYLLLIVAVFWSAAALALPLVAALSRVVFRQRARQYDLRRARRQAHGIGALPALCVALAGMRVLTPLSVVLVALILIVAEMLFLSFLHTEA